VSSWQDHASHATAWRHWQMDEGKGWGLASQRFHVEISKNEHPKKFQKWISKNEHLDTNVSSGGNILGIIVSWY
jgi:hypothetical protein